MKIVFLPRTIVVDEPTEEVFDSSAREEGTLFANRNAALSILKASTSI